MATTKLNKLTLKRQQINAQIQALKAKESQQNHVEVHSQTKRSIFKSLQSSKYE